MNKTIVLHHVDGTTEEFETFEPIPRIERHYLENDTEHWLEKVAHDTPLPIRTKLFERKGGPEGREVHYEEMETSDEGRRRILKSALVEMLHRGVRKQNDLIYWARVPDYMLRGFDLLAKDPIKSIFAKGCDLQAWEHPDQHGYCFGLGGGTATYRRWTVVMGRVPDVPLGWFCIGNSPYSFGSRKTGRSIPSPDPHK